MRSIVFIVNGGEQSAMGQRARALAACLRERYEIRLAYRKGSKVRSLLRFLSLLRRLRPEVVYVFDMSPAGVLGGWLYRMLYGKRLVVETGDAIYELMRSTGNRGRLGLFLTRQFEKFSLRVADRIVVRGRFHRQLLDGLGIKASVIQDGVDIGLFTPLSVADLRGQYELEGVLTVGFVGSSIWSEKLQMCYGWELVQLMRLLKHAPVKGIVIGNGSGIPKLKAQCREYGIEDKMLFLGYVPHGELPRYLNLIDVCLSTQTNDIVGQVRTSGKLPLYLATGRYVLASEVGEAALVLDQEMLVPYDGVQDREYPSRLAERVRAILHDPQKLKAAQGNVELAKKFFEYAMLAERLSEVVETLMGEEKSGPLAEPQAQLPGPAVMRAERKSE